jgi:hypothetical protein
MELRLTAAAIVATLPLLSAGAAQTIKFGDQPGLPFPFPGGAVPNGYKGFNWHGATNAELFDTSTSGFGSASIFEMSRTSAFDLDNMVIQNLESDAPSGGDTTNYSTVISGFFNGTLVKTVTEDYGFGGGNLFTLNMDGVNDVKFATTEINTRFGESGTFTSPDFTLVSQMKVENFTRVTKAPELDPTATASAVTLLLGSLLVITGRRQRFGMTSKR